jgi:hypothetical protein
MTSCPTCNARNRFGPIARESRDARGASPRCLAPLWSSGRGQPSPPEFTLRARAQRRLRVASMQTGFPARGRQRPGRRDAPWRDGGSAARPWSGGPGPLSPSTAISAVVDCGPPGRDRIRGRAIRRLGSPRHLRSVDSNAPGSRSSEAPSSAKAGVSSDEPLSTCFPFDRERPPRTFSGLVGVGERH